MKRALSIGLLVVLLSVVGLFAKRAPGPEVAPVRFQGVIYTVTAEPDKMGLVEAFDEDSKKKLWEKKIYSISVSPGLEADTQWVFITSMQLEGKVLILSNERGEWFSLDPATREVRKLPKR